MECDIDPASQPARNPRRPWHVWLAGMLIGDAVIVLLFGAGVLMISGGSVLSMLVIPSFLLAPLVGGVAASYYWRSLRPRVGAICLNTLWMTLLASIAGAVVFREGTICLVILFPLFFASALTGALLGRIWFKGYPTRLQVSVLPLLAVAVLAEPFTRHGQEQVITDEIIIRAPARKVWPQLTSFPEIPATPRFWLFRMGLPYPVATTSAGDFVNADRQCIFSHGAIFKERVIELTPLQKLTFQIVESPNDPELVGHLTAHRGQFVLRDNPDGTTTLIGSTWYTLHVRPLWYFDLWTQHIFRSVHLRVMEDIRRRAESAP